MQLQVYFTLGVPGVEDGLPVVISAQARQTDAVVIEGVGDGIVAALVLASNEFGVDNTVTIPLRQLGQGLLGFRLHRAVNQLTIPVLPQVRQVAVGA